MSTTRNVAIIVGSLRKDSFNRRLAQALIGLAPASLKLAIVEIRDLPIFNQDFEADPPEAARKFKQSIQETDAVLFVTPEYNRSMPGGLKNAIDVASRPYGKSAWSGKPAAVISASPGAIGGYGANHHLRQCLVFLDMPCLQQPEAYIGQVNTILDDQGGISKPESKDFLVKFLQRFADWIEHNAPAKA